MKLKNYLIEKREELINSILKLTYCEYEESEEYKYLLTSLKEQLDIIEEIISICELRNKF